MPVQLERSRRDREAVQQGQEAEQSQGHESYDDRQVLMKKTKQMMKKKEKNTTVLSNLKVS